MRKEQDAASLEDLLRLQEQFQARSEVPAAKVTFVGGARRQAESASQGNIPDSYAAGSHQDTSTGEVELQEHEAAHGSKLVGNVMERVVETTQPPSVPTLAAAGGGFPLAKHHRQSRFALSRRVNQNTGPPTEAAASQGETASAVDAAHMSSSGAEIDIDAQSRAALEHMSPVEVEEARKEIEDRLGPEKVAFLRKRAAQRAQQAAQRAEPHQNQPKGTGDLTPSLKAPGSQGTWHPPGGPQSNGAQTGGRAVSRIRFSSNGDPVGWKSAVEEEAAQTSVVERDLLRQDEGTVSEGYTVHEMCQLARSSLPAQRAFACRHLAALLARARPLMADAHVALFGNGRIPKPLNVPGSDLAPCLDWEDAWEHALKDCQVAVVLRVALDDNSQSVIMWAADALAQLVALESIGPSRACPTPSGLAAVPSRYLERPHVLSAWSALPIDIPKPPEMPSTPQNAAEEELEQQLDERQVAAKDPLAGLLQMQVLARISYLLQAGVGPAAADSLMKILHATALGGNDMVSAICNTPGLVKAMLGILDDAPSGGSGHSLEQALHPVRPHVLCVLRMLCQAGADVARHLLGQGLKAQVTRFVLGSGIAPTPADSTALLMECSQIEAWRIWRICACYGLNVLSLDDAYPVLWPRLGTPEWASLSAHAGTGLDAQSTWLHMTTASEMLMTVAELLLHAGRAPDQAQVSPRCAAALLQEAVAWLQPQPLQGLFDYVIGGTSAEGSGSDSGRLAAQAALLALAAILEIFWACTLLPYMSDASSKAAALVGELSAHTQPQTCPQATGHSQGSFVCKLLTFLMQLLGPLQIDGEPTPSLTQARAGVVVATCEVLSGCLRTCHAAGSRAENALKQLTATLPLQRNAPELVTMQPSAAGAFQVQQAILNLILTDVEHALQRPDNEHAWLELLDAALRVPSLAPPGGEDLALRAMSCALHGHLYTLVHKRGTELVRDFSKGGSSFAIAAGMLGAWWQEGDSEVKDNPLPMLPTASAVRDALLPAYTAHWLGLIPEGPPTSVNADGSPAAKSTPAADVAHPAPLPKHSLVRQPVGSRLPTPPDWMFGIEPVPVEVRPSAGLDTISEEGAAVGTPQPERPGRAGIAGLGLLFLLALQAETALPCMNELPVGVKLRGLMDLVFSPATPSSSNGEGNASDTLWLDPLIRWTTATLLDTYARHMPTDRLVGSITEADTARWAAQFAMVSYGDTLFASALALLLRPEMPGPVQVTVLEILAEEGALHLLPPLHRAPGGTAAYIGPERPMAVTRLLGNLLEDGSLQKAEESNSMVHDLAMELQIS